MKKKQFQKAFDTLMEAVVALAVLVLLLLVFFFLNSCSVIKKFRHSETVERDSVGVVKRDTLSYVHKDSVFTNHEQSEKVNTVEIELSDSATEDTDTLRIPIYGGDYFYVPVKQKIKRITLNNSQIVNTLQHAAITEESLQKSSKTDSVAKKEVSKSVTKEVSKCSALPFWLIVAICLIALLSWLFNKYGFSILKI